MSFSYRSLALLASLLTLPLTISLAVPLGCATTNPNAAKYPPRPGSCKIRVFHTPAPEVKEWDDLGMAHVDCPLDVGTVQCLKRLRIEGCRMGGDIIYDVPKKPLRPTEQGMVYAGHVAHTKDHPSDAGKDDDDKGTGELDQPEEPSSGPVQPVEPIAAPAPSGSGVPLVPLSPISRGHADGGSPADGGR